MRDKENQTYIRKIHFKKFSQIFLAHFLSSSFNNKKKICMKPFLIFMFIENAKNLLYSETLSELRSILPDEILKKSFFLSDSKVYDSKEMKIIHSFLKLDFLKERDLVLIKTGKYKKTRVRIEKIKNDFLFFKIGEKIISENYCLRNIKKENKYSEKNIYQTSFLKKVRLDGATNFKRNNPRIRLLMNLEKSINKKNNFFKNSLKENNKFHSNLGKFYFNKKDLSWKALIHVELSHKRFLNINGSIEIVERKKVFQNLTILEGEANKAIDLFGNIFSTEDVVKVIIGINKGIIGIVSSIKEEVIVIRSPLIEKNSGFLILGSKEVFLYIKNVRYKKSKSDIFFSSAQKKISYSASQKFSKNQISIEEIEAVSRGKVVNISNFESNLKKFI